MRKLMYGGVQPPSSFSGHVIIHQQPKTNHTVNTNVVPTYNPTGYQTAKYNANQQVYIPNPYGVGPLTERKQVVVEEPPKIILPEKPKKQQVIIRPNQHIYSADSGKPLYQPAPLPPPPPPPPAPPVPQLDQEPNILLPYELDCEIYNKDYGEDINKRRYKTMLQHNNCMCIQPAETSFDVTIFVVYTNNLTLSMVHEAMSNVMTVKDTESKHSVKYLITKYVDVGADEQGQKPYHDGKYHEHKKYITFNDPKMLTYRKWQKLIPYIAVKDRKSDLINNLIMGASLLINPEGINFCTNLNKFFAREYIQDKKVVPPPKIKKSDDDDDDDDVEI